MSDGGAVFRASPLGRPSPSGRFSVRWLGAARVQQDSPNQKLVRPVWQELAGGRRSRAMRRDWPNPRSGLIRKRLAAGTSTTCRNFRSRSLRSLRLDLKACGGFRFCNVETPMSMPQAPADSSEFAGERSSEAACDSGSADSESSPEGLLARRVLRPRSSLIRAWTPACGNSYPTSRRRVFIFADSVAMVPFTRINRPPPKAGMTTNGRT